MSIKGKPTPPLHDLNNLFDYCNESGVLWWKKDQKRAGHKRADGYICVGIGGSVYLAHRIIYKMITGCEAEYIDHINGNRSDNRASNIRSVSSSVNNKNARARKDNSSGTTGVVFCKKTNRWLARIKVEKKFMHLGCFINKAEAIRARKMAEKKYNFSKNHGRRRSDAS